MLEIYKLTGLIEDMLLDQLSYTPIKISSSRLVECFNSTFLDAYKTQLIGGYEAPYYAPGSECETQNISEIRFTHDSVQSALHEIAHWCVAGSERRKISDYGYWYRPDGRSPSEQKDFFNLEVKPQAIECAFSMELGLNFEVSCDNLSSPASSAEVEIFKSKVDQQLLYYRHNGFPKRAQLFLDTLKSLHHRH